MKIRIAPMNDVQWTHFMSWCTRLYAEANAREGRWDPASAEANAAAEFREIAPQGQATPGHSFNHIVDDDGPGTVGQLWFVRRQEGGTNEMFIYWLGIDEPNRKKGYAAAALRALDDEARSHHVLRIGLHVFAGNSPAISLYQKMGYVTTGHLMARSVPTPGE
ncbi:MAG TPA: GNAT family N-acetyltransferase [Thermoplasmata archaeon]|nr:GNAT family N-acetyltransferase [Thermoplasmata archaeon]